MVNPGTEDLFAERTDSQSVAAALVEADSSVVDSQSVAAALAEADRLVARGKP